MQYTVELIPDVDRAYVHLDFEYEHRPSTEHYRKGEKHSVPVQKDLNVPLTINE